MYSMVDDPRKDTNKARVGELGKVVEQLSKRDPKQIIHVWLIITT